MAPPTIREDDSEGHTSDPSPSRSRKISTLSVSGMAKNLLSRSMPRSQNDKEDIFFGIPFMGKTSFPLSDFCTGLLDSLRAENATATSLLCYAKGRKISHRFLLIGAKLDDDDFWIRLERRPKSRNPFILFSSYQAAKDKAKLTWARKQVLDGFIKPEASIRFKTPVPLKRLGKALDVIRDGSTQYSLSKENCWFFASLIQEISVQFLGGRFLPGEHANHLWMSHGRRKAIKTTMYTMVPTDVQALVKDLESLVLMTSDTSLHSSTTRLTRILETQDRLLHCCPLTDAKLDEGLCERMVGILSDCKRVVYEHLHGLSDVHGARRLRETFSTELDRALDPWESSLDQQSTQILSRHQVDILVGSVRHVFENAFDDGPGVLSLRREPGPGSYKWTKQEPYPSADLKLALWTLKNLSFSASFKTLIEKCRYRLNRDVSDLQSEFNETVPKRTQFACKSWSALVCRVDCKNEVVIHALDNFIRKWLRYWIVAMGVMGEVDAACLGLDHVERWMRPCKAFAQHRLFISHMYRFILRSKQALRLSSFIPFTGSLPFESGPRLGGIMRSNFTPESLHDGVLVSAEGNFQHSSSRALLKRRDHEIPFSSVAYSPEGTRLVSASRSNEVEVWSTSECALLYKLHFPSICVFAVFSPDGDQVACASEDNVVYICDAAPGGTNVTILRGHAKRVNAVAFSPYGHRLASASADKTIRIWDLTEASHLTLHGHSEAVISVAYSPHGALLASGSFDGSVRVWDAAGSKIRILEVGSAIFSIAFHRDNGRVIFACEDSAARIWNPYDMEPAKQLHGHKDSVYSVSSSPDGALIASASVDKTIRLWNSTTSRPVRTLEGHAGKVYSVAFSPDGAHVASASQDCSIRIWDVENPVHRDDSTSPFTIATSSYGGTTASVSDKIIHINYPRHSIPLRGHTDAVTSACFSPDDTQLASASRDLTVRIWDADMGRCLKTMALDTMGEFHEEQWKFHWRPEAPYHMCYSKDGSILRISGWKVHEGSGQPFTFYLDTQTWTDAKLPRSDMFPSSYLPDPSLPVLLKENCLCVKRKEGLAYICWLPDDFEPISDVLQTGKRVSIGGKDGEVVHVNFEGLDFSSSNSSAVQVPFPRSP